MRIINFISKWVLLLAIVVPALAQDAGDVGRTDSNVAKLIAAMLQGRHFSHHPLDEEMGGKFLDRYLDMLDGARLYFLQSDIDEFNNAYRTNLNEMTLKGDVSPAQVIFQRFLQRMQERQEYVLGLIQADHFTFTNEDRLVTDRRKAERPRNRDEARALWQQVLRFEYLNEKLNAPNIKFAGPASLDSDRNVLIQLTRDKERPLSFDFLPKTFYDENKKQIGSVNLQSESNAVVTIQQNQITNKTRFDQNIYSDTGVEIGKVGCRWQTNDVELPESVLTNAEAAPVTPQTTNEFVGVIQLNEKDFTKITETLTNRYTQMLKNWKGFDHDDVFEIYMEALARAYDPHTDYMGKSQFENFNISLKLSLAGIGAVLRSEDGYCKIESIMEGGPAGKSGKLKPGDRIVAVAQGDKEPVDVIGMKLPKVVEKIRGPKGTKVRLTIIPVGADTSARRVITLIRDEIKLEDSEAKAKLFISNVNGKEMRVGVIDLPSFYRDDKRVDGHVVKSTTDDVTRLITRLKKENVDGIILDLRRNGGGFLEEAISLTGLFITTGPVVQTKEPTGEIVTDSDADTNQLYDGPLIVLTSRLSASASEIVAGALQDYGRALIVGDESTFGKGTVQAPEPLAPYFQQRGLVPAYDPGVLKLTIRKFYRAGGASTQLKGVESDIVLPSVLNYMDINEASMPNALPWDTVPSAGPENLNLIHPFVAELEKASAQRLQTNKDFGYIREDIDDCKKRLKDSSVSLNEQVRLAEKKSLEARDEARKKERLSRPKPDDRVYEITLKNVDLAELQPPTVKTNALATTTRADIPDLSGDEEPPVDTKAEDAALQETIRIMQDYILLLRKTPPVPADVKNN